MKTLFNIQSEHAAFLDLLSENDGEQTDETFAVLETWFSDIQHDEGVKLDSIVGVIRTLEAERDAAEMEWKRWAERAAVRDNAVDRLKLRVKDYLLATGRTKAVTASGRPLRIQTNGGKQACHLAEGFDAADLPKDYVVVKYSPDLDAIRDSLTTWGDDSPVAGMARLEERGNHLRVG